MALKKYNPTSNGQRQRVSIDRSHLWSGSPLKSLVFGVKRSSGRSNIGRITVHCRGGSSTRRVLRKVDFFRRDHLDMKATVIRMEYDPGRSAEIALLQYENGDHSYIICPEKLSVGDVIMSSEENTLAVKPGNCMRLKNIPSGISIHNIEVRKGRGAQIVRSAGTSARISGSDGDKIGVRLSSGELKYIDGDCLATIGAVGNSDHKNTVIGKAGRSRWMGIRPRVRRVAMNPVDHPLGGGEGRSSGGRHPCNRAGLRKGTKTRSRKKPKLNYLVKNR